MVTKRQREQWMRSNAIVRVLENRIDGSGIGSLADLRQAYQDELATESRADRGHG